MGRHLPLAFSLRVHFCRNERLMMSSLFGFALLCYLWCVSVASPVSNPHISDEHLGKVIPGFYDVKQGKDYHKHTPARVDNGTHVNIHGKPVKAGHSQGGSHHIHAQCSVGLRLRWSAECGSSIFSTPVIYPSGSQGRKQIFVNTFYQFLEIIGFDGYKPWGWPISFEGSSFQGSPIIHDIDEDGVNDIGAVDKDGNMYWVRLGEFGQYLDDFHAQIPKLKVQKGWADNLNPDFADKQVLLTMFDHEGHKHAHGGEHNDETSSGGLGSRAKMDVLSLGQKAGQSQSHSQVSYPELGRETNVGSMNVDKEATTSKRSRSAIHDMRRRRLQSSSEEEGKDEGGGGGGGGSDERRSGDDDDGDAARMPPPLPSDDELSVQHYMYGTDVGAYHDDGGLQPYYNMQGLGEEHDAGGTSKFVFVDAHVLGTPTLADINGDGHLELIMAVSYYFDKAHYKAKKEAGELDFEPADYVAGGVVAWDLTHQTWSWTVHLDMTTDHTEFKALIHGSPTVADLDGDGASEVIVGTALGLLYVLDGSSGFVRRYFPMQFHAIEASIAVADIVGGSNLEMIVVDMGGNVVVVDVSGEVLWDASLSGGISVTPTVGDVDGDGDLDVVVITSVPSKDKAGGTRSHIWALDGATGHVLPNYPLILPGGAEASSSALLVDLHNYYRGLAMTPTRYADPTLPPWMQFTPGHQPAPAPSLNHFVNSVHTNTTASSQTAAAAAAAAATTADRDKGGGARGAHGPQVSSRPKGLHVIVPADDGHLYVIDGRRGCAERVDLGQHVASMPLADDVTGDGLLDIVVGTMNGELILLETDVPYHALNAWSSFPKHRHNGFTHGVSGISVPLVEKRRLRTMARTSSRNVSLTFDIWDARHHLGPGERHFTVTFSKGTSRAFPLLKKRYTSPGRYTVELPLAPPDSFTLLVGMTNEHNQYFEESIPLSVGTGYYVWIKYLILTPLLLFIVPLHVMRTK